jgi:hypothetical protein
MSEFTVTRTLKAPYERVPNPGSPRMRPDTTHADDDDPTLPGRTVRSMKSSDLGR